MAEAPTSPLLTDLYQLNMVQTYLERGMTDVAVFEFFVRSLPERRGFLIAAGLEQALDYLETLRFSPADIDWLAKSGQFGPALIDRLADFRFTGEVHAMAEGAAFFGGEPILRVSAPLPEAQLVELRLINILHFQSLVASKAARMRLAAPGKLLVDFGLRRAHGGEAGLMAARASYLTGFAGTATVLAGQLWDVPLYGTMAHALVQAFDSEIEAFEAYARSRPEGVIFLLDTYETLAAARKVVTLAPRLAAAGVRLRGVRLDSGDLAALARAVRQILDQGGLGQVIILASGGLDEDDLVALEASGAPIDGYGLGTCLVTSSDAPTLDCVYKLEEYAGQARRKHSAGKATWPGRKQVWRTYGADGRMAGDVLSIEHDVHPGEPLLQPVMRAGRRIEPPPSLAEIRARAARDLDRLPSPLKALQAGASYPVKIGGALVELAEAVDRWLAEQEGQTLTAAIEISETDVLLVIDLQVDFCPGGALAVPTGDEIVPVINALQPRFAHVMATQDWHPADHASFASAHAGLKPFETVTAAYGEQILWPDHCVQGTDGARLHPTFDTTRVELVLRKGFRRQIDSYSAFLENDRTTPTGLAGYLRERGLQRVFLAGLALDFCVLWSAKDARRLGFEVMVLTEACRSLDVGGSGAAALAELEAIGATCVPSDALEGSLHRTS